MLSADRSRRRRLVQRCLAILIGGAAVAAVTNYAQRQVWVATIFLVAALVSAALFAAIRLRKLPLLWSGNAFAAIVFVTLTSANLVSGGFGLPAHFAMGLVPLFAVVTAGQRSGVLWMIVCGVEVGAISTLHAVDFEFLQVPGPEHELELQTVGALVTLGTVGAMAIVYEGLKDGALQQAHEAHEFLARAKLEAERASEAKSQFLANMSHEIRTPMNGIVGTLELIRDAETIEEARERIHIAHASAITLLGLLDEIVDLSRVEKGTLELAERPCDLHDVIRGAVQVLAPLAMQRGISLTVQIEEHAPREVLVDDRRLGQIVTNLVSNAVEFTREGGVEVRLAPGPTEVGQESFITVEIADTGEGIPPDHLETIFEEFSQVDSGATRAHGGAGLGLAIARRLAGLMGGDLTVDSELGVGSTFTLSLPVRPSALVEVAAPLGSAPADLHVLIVDDVATNRTIAAAMLQKLGHRTEAVEDGRAAVDAALTGRFDLVMMDCQMPVLDGYRATHRIREGAGEAAAIPIVAMTGNAMTGDRERCEAAGMDDYVAKPLTLRSLEEVLARLASRGRLSACNRAGSSAN